MKGPQGGQAAPANPEATLSQFRQLQQQFLRERRYLKNITERSAGWYAMSLRQYSSLGDNATCLPTKARLQQFVFTLRERGVQPVTINSYPNRRAQNQGESAVLFSEGIRPLNTVLRAQQGS